MKIFLLACLAITIFSCENKKEVIVEQIKAYKDSINNVSRRELGIGMERDKISKKYSDKMAENDKKTFDAKTSSQMRAITDDNSRLINEQINKLRVFDSANYRETISLDLKKIWFKSKIDSLELELKKY